MSFPQIRSSIDTACKALWKCNDRLEPFDQFKC